MEKNAAEPDLVKASSHGESGPHGYIHGWIKVGPGDGVESSRKEVRGEVHYVTRIKNPKGGEGGRKLSENQVKPGHVVRSHGNVHYVITGKTGGYKLKNPAHPDGMRKFTAVPVNDDGSVGTEEHHIYFDRDAKVHVAGHVPGTAGERANNAGNPSTRRFVKH